MPARSISPAGNRNNKVKSQEALLCLRCYNLTVKTVEDSPACRGVTGRRNQKRVAPASPEAHAPSTWVGGPTPHCKIIRQPESAMLPYDLTGYNADLFITRTRNGVIWCSGVRSNEELLLEDLFGKEVVWVKVVFCSRHHDAASRIGAFSLN